MVILLSIDTIGIGVGTIGTVSISSIETTIAISKTVSTIVGISLGLGISGPLGNMDDSSRVGDISASTSVSSSNSGEGSRGDSGNANSVSGIGHTITGSIGTSIGVGTIGVGGGGVASITVSSIEKLGISISVSLDESSEANLKIRQLFIFC